MDCPLCLSHAKNLTPPGYRGLVIACPRCGAFRVTENAVAPLASLKVEDRLAALERAKMVMSSTVPTVSSGCLQLGGRRKGASLAGDRTPPQPKPRTFSLRPRPASMLSRG
jgi:hypothetical protein